MLKNRGSMLYFCVLLLAFPLLPFFLGSVV